MRDAQAVMWPYQQGDRVRRTELQERMGGRTQGGISPSNRTPNVILFSSEAGHAYGYHLDGWQNDELFHYTGEGQVGPQVIRQGNRAVLEHRTDPRGSRALRLFDGSAGLVTYVGQFELYPDEPYFQADARDAQGDMRTVIVFRLKPVAGSATPPAELPPPRRRSPRAKPLCEEVPLEAAEVARFTRQPVAPGDAERREAALVRSYCDYLARQHEANPLRLRLQASGEVISYYTDLYEPRANRIIEAKATSTREAARMAVGQLLDYRNLSGRNSRLAVLLPDAPRPTVANYFAACGVEVIHAAGGGSFADGGQDKTFQATA